MTTALLGAATAADYETDVLILGAGGAGLSTAAGLAENFPSVGHLVLEARDTIGGRMYNVDLAGTTVQKGASWVQGTEGSRMYDLVKAGNVEGTFTDWDSVSITDPNSDDDYADYYDITSPAWELWEEQKNCTKDLAKNLKKDGRPDVSMRAAARMCGWGRTTSSAGSPIEMAVEWLGHDFEYAEPPVTTSVKNGMSAVYENFKDEDYFVTDPRGWLPMLEQLNVPEDIIHLGTLVTKIEYDSEAVGGGVTVTAEKDGETVTYKADQVVTTLSLGVMQADMASLFSPPLPDWKVDELFKFDMNTFTKIFMKFEEQFWGDDEFFMHASPKRGFYPHFHNLNSVGYFPGSNGLLATVTGDESARVERLSDAEVAAEITAVLRSLFGPDVPEPIEIIVPRWRQDPLFRGSYSNWPIGTTAHDHSELRTPVGSLFFAGEHTHPTMTGYVHGALESGFQAALEVGACRQDPDSEMCACASDHDCDSYTLETRVETTLDPRVETTLDPTAASHSGSNGSSAECPSTAGRVEAGAAIGAGFAAFFVGVLVTFAVWKLKCTAKADQPPVQMVDLQDIEITAV